MSTPNAYQKSLIRDNSSAVAYAPLVFTDGEYIPTIDGEERLFSGLYVHPGASGDITIVGVAGLPFAIPLSPGVWPFGGVKILAQGTTIDPTKVTVLF